MNESQENQDKFDSINDISSTELGSQPTNAQLEEKLNNELLSLSKFEYVKSRKELAKRYDIGVGTLDELRKDLLTMTQTAEAQDKKIVEDLTEWPKQVNGEILADQIRECICSYCVLPQHSDVALTLWVMSSYSMNSFRIYPRLAISSPQMRCGKTTTLEVLQSLTFKALVASNLSSAVLFRVIDKYKPTLLIDELDTFMDGDDELRGIINSGHNKAGAKVIRCTGDNHEPEAFSTWAPMVMARIGSYPPTIVDRSIVVPIQRKPAGICLKKMPIELTETNTTLRRKLIKWSSDNSETISQQESAIPDVDNHRAVDNWKPLITVADLIGGKWPNLAREAMRSIESQKSSDDETTLLLKDILELCGSQEGWQKAIPSNELTYLLNQLDDSPWPSMRQSQGISSHKVGKMLKPFGLITGTVRVNEDKFVRGYRREKFNSICLQYIPEKTITTSPTNESPHVAEIKHNTSDEKPHSISNVLNFEKPNSMGNASCDVVTPFEGSTRMENGITDGDSGNEEDKSNLKQICSEKHSDWLKGYDS